MKLKQRALISILVFIILAAITSTIYFFVTQEKVDGILWTGRGSESKCSSVGSGENDWSCPNNWKGRVVPREGDIVVFNKGEDSERAIIDEGFGGKIKSLIINGYKGEVIQKTDLEITEELNLNTGVYSVPDIDTALTVNKLLLKEGAEFFLGTEKAIVNEMEIDDIRNFHEAAGSSIGIKNEESWRNYAISRLELEIHKPVETVDEYGLGTGKYSLTNLNSNLVAYISVNGLEMQAGIRGEENQSDWLWTFDIKSLTQGSQEVIFESISDDTISKRGDLIEIQRGGNLVEWYDNKFEGIVQGFTIAEKLGSSGNLKLSATINTNLDISEKDREKIVFTHNGGVAIKFQDLKAVDNNNRSLSIWFEYTSWNNELLEFMIVVDDTDAVYPLVIK